ncbi:DUF4124 domain-containing protein [Aquabacterium sp. A7-Y]|uniref:DUF4124 domain-containing protein n=1 Tax=Aquabacterium sp. A7-Y TaxID=1349605 RepID=UPI00223D86C3|nr:DUF4124 domain-containing protein [Aquabacterium sp. A7-Y]MCW7541236.1 DUF4124 domain-containing protein [Aquabacterium sp. A7-Y]
MRTSTVFLSLPGLALALGVAAAGLSSDARAQGQVYRCRDAFGAATVSDRPCPGARMGSVAPPPHHGNSSGWTPPSSPTRNHYYSSQQYRLPDHYAYLSPRCQQLHDAIRTAGARGVGYQTQSDLHAEWRRQCSASETDAWQQARDANRSESRQREEAAAAVRRERAEVERRREQCAELRGALTKRKAREATMTEGERGDLRRFEANYQERCSAA